MPNTTLNVGLQAVGTGLIALGATTIGADLLTGAIEIILGLVVYAVYELIP